MKRTSDFVASLPRTVVCAALLVLALLLLRAPTALALIELTHSRILKAVNGEPARPDSSEYSVRYWLNPVDKPDETRAAPVILSSPTIHTAFMIDGLDTIVIIPTGGEGLVPSIHGGGPRSSAGQWQPQSGNSRPRSGATPWIVAETGFLSSTRKGPSVSYSPDSAEEGIDPPVSDLPSGTVIPLPEEGSYATEESFPTLPDVDIDEAALADALLAPPPGGENARGDRIIPAAVLVRHDPSVAQVQSVPVPGTLALLAPGVMALAYLRRRGKLTRQGPKA